MNPLILLGAIPSALAVGALAWLLHTVDVGRIEAQQRDALTEQATALQEQCQADKRITEEASAKYQKDLSALDAQLNALKLQKPARCVAITPSKPKPRPDDIAKPLQLVGPYGLSSEWLYDFAAEGERYRLQVLGLQGFIRSVWKANGQ